MSTDFDRLHAAWADLDRRVNAQEDGLLTQQHDTRVARLRRRLRPLAIDQGAQCVLGLALAVTGGAVAASADGPVVVGSAVAIQAYGIACIVWACATLALLARLDFAQPVMTLQTRLLRLQRIHLVGNVALGLAWWVLWVPLAITVFGAAGGDYLAHIGPALHTMLAACGAGLVGTVAVGILAWRRPAGRRVLKRTLLGSGLHEVSEELAALADHRH